MGAVACAENYPEFGVMGVRAQVGLITNGEAHDLSVALDITLPELTREQAQHLVDKGKDICAYSRALSGQIEYHLHES